MNKKKLLYSFILPFLAVALVSAIGYYALFSVTLNVHQPVSVDGDLEQSIDCVAGETCLGTPITITNDGENSRALVVSEETDDGIETSYYSEYSLVEKVVDFESDVWSVVTEGDSVVVRYTVVGDTFKTEVVDNAKEGYELVYYKDNSDRFENPAEVIRVADVSSNLPYETDGNADEYDYCATGEYLTCNGAKLWYVPSDAINLDNTLDWSRASEFRFESKLVQYNADGEIIVYGNESLTITPVFDLDAHLASGEYNAEITIL